MRGKRPPFWLAMAFWPDRLGHGVMFFIKAGIASRFGFPPRRRRPGAPLEFWVLLVAFVGLRWRVEIAGQIACPFCGQACELMIDTSIASQRFTTDCEVCCRPFEVRAECEPGGVLSLEARAN